MNFYLYLFGIAPDGICSRRALSVPRGQKPAVTTIIITGGTLAKRNCQLSSHVIRCHHMSSCFLGLSASYMIYMQLDNSNDKKVTTIIITGGDTGQEKLSGVITCHQMSSDITYVIRCHPMLWHVIMLSKIVSIICNWIIAMIKSHHHQRPSLIVMHTSYANGWSIYIELDDKIISRPWS